MPLAGLHRTALACPPVGRGEFALEELHLPLVAELVELKTRSTISIAERFYLPREAGTGLTVWITSNPSNSGWPR